MGHDDKTVDHRHSLCSPPRGGAATYCCAARHGAHPGCPAARTAAPGDGPARAGADDRSTVAICGFLESLGYQVHGWGRGVYRKLKLGRICGEVRQGWRVI